MAKISRRDFLKLFLAAVGAFLVIFLQKFSQPVTPEPAATATPFQPPVDFSHWGQDELTFATLTVPYNNLR
jgi:hypothetical protein